MRSESGLPAWALSRYAATAASSTGPASGTARSRCPRARITRRARDATAGLTVTRLANVNGVVSFAGTDYQAGRRWARQAIDVSIVAGSVQLAKDGKIIRVHPIRHDRARELGAFANPKGRPRRKNSAIGNVVSRYRNSPVARVPGLDSSADCNWPYGSRGSVRSHRT